MKTKIKFLLLLCVTLICFSGCDIEDPGPLQDMSKEYSLLDFDQLEMGSGFNISVEEANTFRIKVEGDRRNINDLDVFKSGSTLIIRYDDHSNRSHETYITIEMPLLKKANLSGGSVSVIKGFESDESLDLILSGGSVSQLDAGYRILNVVVSGGSTLKMYGLGDELSADISGASSLNSFDFPVREARVNLTGASMSRLTVSNDLRITASGASNVIYRGNPAVESSVSGGSQVTKD